MTPVARPDTIRSHNLALVLSLLHSDGEMTRAELTRRLGISRSTVRALVGALGELGLVEELVPVGGAGVGRPSHAVVPHHDGPFAFGVDVDPSEIVVAAVGIGGEILAKSEVALDPDESVTPQHVVDAVVGGLERVWREGRPDATPCGLGVSVPGTVDGRTGIIGDAPNLGWRDVDLGRMLAERAPASVPVRLGNDADLALLAEHRRGALRGCTDAVFLMGRQGVGAGLMASGQPLHGHDGHAGEIGHNPLDPAGPPCHCGNRGCLEVYVGEPALLALAGEDGPPTRDAISRLFARARAGERHAVDAMLGVVDPLARAIAGLHNTLNPECVVLGGSLAGVFEVVSEQLVDAVAGYCFDLRREPGLVAPALGDDSALMGAAELGFAALLADPLASAKL